MSPWRHRRASMWMARSGELKELSSCAHLGRGAALRSRPPGEEAAVGHACRDAGAVAEPQGHARQLSRAWAAVNRITVYGPRASTRTVRQPPAAIDGIGHDLCGPPPEAVCWACSMPAEVQSREALELGPRPALSQHVHARPPILAGSPIIAINPGWAAKGSIHRLASGSRLARPSSLRCLRNSPPPRRNGWLRYDRVQVSMFLDRLECRSPADDRSRRLWKRFR